MDIIEKSRHFCMSLRLVTIEKTSIKGQIRIKLTPNKARESKSVQKSLSGCEFLHCLLQVNRHRKKDFNLL